jgi:hypothetical protein
MQEMFLTRAEFVAALEATGTTTFVGIDAGVPLFP